MIKVLCIGVNSVPGSGNEELKYAEKNARVVAKYFETLSNTEVELLTGKEATRSRTFNWINRINKCRAEPGELTVILFLSGRASVEAHHECVRADTLRRMKTNTNEFAQHIGGPGGASPWPSESRRRQKNMVGLERCLWINSNEQNNLEAHRVKTTELLKSLDNPNHRLFLVIDACYRIDSKIPLRDIFEQFKESERFTSLKPYTVISASAVSEYTFEDPSLGHGVLTYYFLQALSGKYTFFLQQEILFFNLLEILDKKVRTHRFVTRTGRKRPLSILMKNGVMAHFSGKSFKLPILEPVPLTLEPGKHIWHRAISQLAHFLTCTRLRVKASLTVCILGIILLLFYLAANSMVRIHFVPGRSAAFHQTLLEPRSFPIDKLAGQMLGRKYYEEFTLYRFKHNWVNALQRKLDEKGKIVLLGNLLGAHLYGINKKQIMEFALRNIDDVFYWRPQDVKRLLKWICREYRNLNTTQKQNTLKLLTKLGKNGKSKALWFSDFRGETDQRLRNLFLEHFYSTDFLEKNIDYLTPYDYLYLKKSEKQVPTSIERRLRKKTETFLRTVVENIPDSHIEITDKNKLSTIYEKLRILASFGSRYFRRKASDIFKKVFFPDQVIYLFWDCRNFQDKLWILELYFKRVQHVNYPDLVWDRLIFRHIPNSTVKEKTGILKTIMNTNLELIPKSYWNNLILNLHHVDPQEVTLDEWEKWIRKYPLDPQYIKYMFYWIINKDYKRVFLFLENHYEKFKTFFTGPVFSRLYEFNPDETIRLAKKIFETSNGKEQLSAAVFLYNKNYSEYSSFIVEFLEKAKNNIGKQQLLEDFSGSINDAVFNLTGNDYKLRASLTPLLKQPNLFYRFFQTNIHFWPEESIKRVLTAKIPKNYDKGRPLLKMVEQLPDVHRKKMLIKIIKSDIETYFRARVEEALAKHYPREFLEMVISSKYKWNRETKRAVVKAYQEFSYESLKDILILNLKKELYWKIDFICEALVNKKDEEPNIRDIRYILEEFDRPLERILLRKLRYFMHKRQFMEVNQ